MTRILGLVLGFLVCGQSASAALLVSYNFTSSGSPTYNGTQGGLDSGSSTASAFSATGSGNGAPGAVNSGSWLTANTVSATVSSANFNRFSITNDNYQAVTIDSLSANIWKSVSGATGTANVKVSYSLNGGTSWVDFGTDAVISNTASSALTTAETLTLTSPVVLTKGKSIDFRFQWYRTGSPANTTRFRFDDLRVFGSVANVPEPLSIATFGLVGAGLAVARRRKQR